MRHRAVVILEELWGGGDFPPLGVVPQEELRRRIRRLNDENGKEGPVQEATEITPGCRVGFNPRRAGMPVYVTGKVILTWHRTLAGHRYQFARVVPDADLNLPYRHMDLNVDLMSIMVIK